jgi:hypothetical protein
MKYAVEKGSTATLHKPIFIQAGSHIQKLVRADTQAHSMVVSQKKTRWP